MADNEVLDTTDPDEGSGGVAGIPLNRIIAFLGPHISWLAGIFATWLTQHVHFLATFHVGTSDVAKAISSGLVFAVVTGVTWLGHQKWLTGHHVQMEIDALEKQGAEATAQALIDSVPEGEVEEGEYNPADHAEQPDADTVDVDDDYNEVPPSDEETAPVPDPEPEEPETDEEPVEAPTAGSPKPVAEQEG